MQPRVEAINLSYNALIVGYLMRTKSILATNNFLSVAKFLYLTYILAADNGSLSITEIEVMETLVGRVAEEKILSEALTSASAELVAVFGRRRVGKTFLSVPFIANNWFSNCQVYITPVQVNSY